MDKEILIIVIPNEKNAQPDAIVDEGYDSLSNNGDLKQGEVEDDACNDHCDLHPVQPCEGQKDPSNSSSDERLPLLLESDTAKEEGSAKPVKATQLIPEITETRKTTIKTIKTSVQVTNTQGGSSSLILGIGSALNRRSQKNIDDGCNNTETGVLFKNSTEETATIQNGGSALVVNSLSCYFPKEMLHDQHGSVFTAASSFEQVELRPPSTGYSPVQLVTANLSTVEKVAYDFTNFLSDEAMYCVEQQSMKHQTHQYCLPLTAQQCTSTGGGAGVAQYIVGTLPGISPLNKLTLTHATSTFEYSKEAKLLEYAHQSMPLPFVSIDREEPMLLGNSSNDDVSMWVWPNNHDTRETDMIGNMHSL